MTVTCRGGGPDAIVILTLQQRLAMARGALSQAQRERRRADADCAAALARIQSLRRIEQEEAQ